MGKYLFQMIFILLFLRSEFKTNIIHPQFIYPEKTNQIVTQQNAQFVPILLHDSLNNGNLYGFLTAKLSFLDTYNKKDLFDLTFYFTLYKYSNNISIIQSSYLKLSPLFGSIDIFNDLKIFSVRIISLINPTFVICYSLII